MDTLKIPLPELSQVLAGADVGRSNSHGLGAQDLTAGACVIDLAYENGGGSESQQSMVLSAVAL